MSRRIALIVGTRPEAVKMAPVWRALKERPEVQPVLEIEPAADLAPGKGTTFGGGEAPTPPPTVLPKRARAGR